LRASSALLLLQSFAHLALSLLHSLSSSCLHAFPLLQLLALLEVIWSGHVLQVSQDLVLAKLALLELWLLISSRACASSLRF
jgi:hypothetical protein